MTIYNKNYSKEEDSTELFKPTVQTENFTVQKVTDLMVKWNQFAHESPPPSPPSTPKLNKMVTATPAEQRFWTKSVLAGIRRDYTDHKGNPTGLKNFLILRLNVFLTRLKEEKSESADLLEIFIDDLNNKSLEELFNKYYASKGEILGFINDLAEIFTKNDAEFSIEELFEKETAEIKEVMAKSLTPAPVNRDSLMRLLVSKKMVKHPHMDCDVVTASEFKEILSYASRLKTGRFQFLVRSKVHYTAVDVEIKEGVLRAAVMDAGGDGSALELAKALKAAQAQEVYLLGALDAIQKDLYNCSFFSLDTVVKSSKDPNFFNLLNRHRVDEKAGIVLVRWDSLPPRFVKNSTSTSYLKEYFDKHPETKTATYKKEKTFEETIRNQIAMRNIEGKEREANTVIEKKIEKYTHISRGALATISNTELTPIVKHSSLAEFIKRHPFPLSETP